MCDALSFSVRQFGKCNPQIYIGNMSMAPIEPIGAGRQKFDDANAGRAGEHAEKADNQAGEKINEI